ncbi:MAG: hypothetical protein WKF91_07730, partial [Segetibacter sp.]
TGDEFDDSKVEMKGAADEPSSELEYSVSEWYLQTHSIGFDINNYKPKPNYVKTKTRKTHYHADALHQTMWQDMYSFSDGGGHEILKKVQAEPGLALQVNADGTVTQVDTTPALRWVGNGRTILNNKGNAVKKYEPYFTTLPTFDDEKEMVELGVTPVIFYDPLGRTVRTNAPDKTFSKVEFTPWQQISYDANDTVRDSEWYQLKGNPNPAGPEPANPDARAAWLAAQHYNTPSVAYVDSLGRTFLTIADNVSEKLSSRIKLDIEGNQLEITDALNRKVMEYKYDKIGNKLYSISIDSGRRWMMNDVIAKTFACH